jgi:type II secretory pathway component GspD/PulD (secretin)
MLDPKIGFGQPDAAGHVVPQPSVSIRWEGITAEQALNALLANHNLQLVEDPKTKIARVTTKDPAAPPDLVTRVIQLKYSSPSNVVAAVQSALTDKRSKVVADVRTSQLVLLATDKELVDVEAMVAKLDTQTKQVLIEAKLLETTINPGTKKGIDWTGTLDAQHFNIGNAGPAGILARLDGGGAFTPAAAFLTADGVSATLSFLNTYGEAKTIASPRTVTLDNETAHISVTDVRPIINVTAGTANTTGGSTITYTNLGITLDVTPRISANDFVNLKVSPIVSRFTGQDKRTIGNQLYVVDLYAARSMDTRVMIPSGHTLVLGGLIQDEITLGNVKVPVLGDIPGLGYLFRSDTKTRKKQNLIVFITPTIVQDTDYQLTPTTYLKTPVPTSDTLDETDWSAWDSGKPKDWSKKGATKD